MPGQGIGKEAWMTRKPNLKTLELMNLAKQKGHKIIIHTSRLSSESAVVTLQWLQKYNVPYDAIHFNKPFYDYVCDDRNKTIEELKDLL